ncbi:hypothetical protein [Tardiphaga sp.]|uniref:hypothetical protein n=1 Tax=Tardiphaga sp. TaxID=1926292 RepID=UPI00352B7C31
MTALADLIKAIAALLWPLLAFAFLWLFKSEIAGILKRLSHLRKGKLLGQEIELNEELDELQRSAIKAEQETVASVPPLKAPDLENSASKNFESDLLSNISKSPKAALMLLAAEIERRLRLILISTGWAQNIKPAPIAKAIDKLREQGSLPEHVSGSIKLFLDVRNKIVHGHSATEEDTLRAIDSGFTVLKSLEAIPFEENVVHHPGVVIYSDALCEHEIADAVGLLLESTSPGRTTKSLRIFPTTRKDYRAGESVAWEWTFDRSWGPAWYRDPRTHEIKQAWLSAAEFIGRHLSDI